MACANRTVNRWANSARSITLNCSDSMSRRTEKVASWLPLPRTARPLATLNSTLIPSLPASHPHAQRNVVHSRVRVVLVQLALDGHTLNRRVGGVVNPAVQGSPYSRRQRPCFAPSSGPARELNKRL